MTKNLFKRFIHSNMGGFSLVEIMIAGGLIGAAAVFGAKVFQKQYSGIKQVEVVSELEAFHESLRRHILEHNNCNATFANYYGRPSVGPIEAIKSCKGNTEFCTIASNHTQFVAKGDKILKVKDTGTTFQYQIDDIIVNPTGATRVHAPFSGLGTNILLVDVVYTRLKKLETGKQQQRLSLMLNMRFDKDGNFTHCSSEAVGTSNSLQKFMCEALNGNLPDESLDGEPLVQPLAFFDANTRDCTLRQFNPDQVCPDRHHYAGMDSQGKKICKLTQNFVNLEDYLNLNTPPTNCESGKRVDLVATGKKIMSKCAGGCVPEKSCSVIASTICSEHSAGTDSCNNKCGKGTKDCKSCDCYLRDSCNIEKTMSGCKVATAEENKCSIETAITRQFCPVQ